MEIGHPNLFGIHTLYSAPLLGTMWFVRDLIILAIFSPIIHWFLKRTKVYGLVIITALYLLRIWPPISLNLISVYFFSLGAYFSIIKKSLLIPKEITIPCVCIALLCLLFFIKNGNESYWGWQLIPLLNLSGVVSVISFAYIFIQKKSIPKYTRLLSDSSFFVYALHIEFTLPLGFFVIKAITFNSTAPLILIVRYFFTPIVIYALSIGIYIALKRTTPKILMLLTGLR